MTDSLEHPDDAPSDEMAEYLQVFMDETEEQLDALVESMLVLENEPENIDELNEAFRLIHSIKGSAGMMGFDNIMALTHHLESRFEGFRSGLQQLDRPTMNLVLRCIDFLRECIKRLRATKPLGSAAQLLKELTALGERDSHDHEATGQAAVESESTAIAPAEDAPREPQTRAGDQVAEEPLGSDRRLTVYFEPGLPLVDLKARLVLSRLADLVEITSARPSAAELETIEELEQLELVLVSDEPDEALRKAIDIDGVREIEFARGRGAAARADHEAHEHESPEDDPASAPSDTPTDLSVAEESESVGRGDAILEVDPAGEDQSSTEIAQTPDEPASVDTAPRSRSAGVETMRVDIDRLDRLMNLAGELVVNRARFVQLAEQMGPAFRRRNVVTRARDFGDSLRRTVEHLQSMMIGNGDLTRDIEELKAGLKLMEEQTELWDSSRRSFGQVSEAIDQLTRISDSLQQGVLDTRMVPVAPLFNRFKRVVRDLSVERGKQVVLQIRGERTELDKRMIDELGDPLVHLVRNSIDHGLEPPEVRVARGKPEAGTIRLEASHSGNNVFIRISDDGGGIDVAKIRERLVRNGIVKSAAQADELSDEAVLEYIWHAGFSTAREVTDISGRGVGMDVVRTRIADLNGVVEVASTPEQGATFTIRLPLTLAIINSLLVRIRDVIFSMPIEDIREIVAVTTNEIVTVRGRQAIDVRGEYIPLISIDDVFDWRDGHENGEDDCPATAAAASNAESVDAVILHTAGKTMGLRVAELLGSQDIVIKSLSENFIQIPGLSGASILGDGAVCLMLDVGAVIDLAVKSARRDDVREEHELDASR